MLSLVAGFFVTVQPISPAQAVSTPTSVGATGDNIAVNPNTTVSLSTLLTHQLVVTGFPSSENVLAILTTSAGTLDETATVGVSAPLGYQGTVTNAAATIAITGTTANVNLALATVQLNAPSSGRAATISVSVTDAGTNSIAYNPANGHYYQYVTTPLSWDAAYNAITGDSLTNHLTVANVGARLAQTGSTCAYKFNGMCGYFATVSNADESTFIANKVGSSSAWLGGSDRIYEGRWVWSDPNAPEYNKQFSDQSSTYTGQVDQTGVYHAGVGTNTTGQAVPYTVGGVTSTFANWNSGEPNNSSGNENALQIVTGGSGQWNDLLENSSTMGYIVEYGGNGEVLNYPKATRTINVNVNVPTPVLGAPTSAATGFTVQITNWGGAGVTAATVTTTAGTVTVSGSGLITVTGLNTGVSATITVIATASGGTSPAVTATGSAATGGTLTIIAPSNGATLTGNVSVPFSYAMKFSGGAVPETATVSSGTLPAGLAISNAGVISGTPSVAGTSVVSLTISGSASPSESATVTGVSIVISGAPLAITSPAAGATLNATVGVAFTGSIVVTGGTAPDTVTVTSGTLPAGLTLSSSGAITGTPTSPGNSTLTFHVVDSATATADVAGVHILVAPNPNAPAPTDFSISHNGSTQYETTTAQVIPATGSFTVEAWVNPAEGINTNARTIVSQGSVIGTGGSTGNRFYMKRYNGQLYYYVDGQVTSSINGTAITPVAAENKCGLIPQGQWTHIAVTITSTNALCYLNGVLQVTTVLSGAHAIGSGFVVGGYSAAIASAGTKFVGQIDEVKVWNVARSLSNIQATMNVAPSLNAANLTAYYDFNAGAGLTVANTATGSDAVASSNLSIVGVPNWTDNNSQTVVGGYTVTQFNRSYITSAGGWTAPLGVTSIDVMVVGGGGGGGKDGGSGGAGGGAYVATGVTIDNGSLLAVQVATGGNAGLYNIIPDSLPVLTVSQTDGGNSSVVAGGTTFLANGGAAGITGISGSHSAVVSGGSSSGTGGSSYSGSSGGFGFSWGLSGGYGGVGADGTFANNWLGSPIIYGGGGAGGADRAGSYLTAVPVVLGGAGGGGNSGGLVAGNYVPATPGAAGTGGGGGAGLADSASQAGKSSAAGGSGLVLVRYQAPIFSANTPTFPATSVSVATAAQVVTVTNSGSSALIFGAAAIAISGTNASDFAISADTCSNQSLAISSTCTVSITFTPGASGERSAILNFTSNAYGNVQQVNLLASASAAPIVITAPTASGTINVTTGSAYTYALAFTGGNAPLTVTISSGTLPTGLSMDSNGAITGTATATGTFVVTFLVTGATGETSSVASVSFVVANPAPASTGPVWTPPAPTIPAVTPPTITSGSPANFNVTTPGATGYAVSGGALPAGLTLNPTTGAITGTPTASGPYSFTITVTNVYGVTSTITLSGNIAAAPVTTPTPGTGTTGSGSSTGSGSTGTGSGSTGSGTSGSGSTGSGAGTLPSLAPVTPPPSVISALLSLSSTPTKSGSGSTATPNLSGNTSVLVNGSTIVATITPNTAGTGYVVSAPGWTLNLQPLDSNGTPVPLNGNSQIVLASNRLVGVSGDGFLPNSIVNVYLFSTPKLLGTVTTDAAGKFTANFPVDSTVIPGNHVVQVNGLSPAKEVRSASVGLLVQTTAQIAASNAASATASNTNLTKAGATGVVPFNAAKIKVESASQLSIVKSFKFTKGASLQIVGYASKTSGEDDLRVSLDRALEVKSALLKLHPDLNIKALGGGVTKNPLCTTYKNQCAVVKVTR